MRPPGGGCSAGNLSTGQLSVPPHRGPSFGRAGSLEPRIVFLCRSIAPNPKKEVTSPEVGGHPLPCAEPLAPLRTCIPCQSGPMKRVSHGLNARCVRRERVVAWGVPPIDGTGIGSNGREVSGGRVKSAETHRAVLRPAPKNKKPRHIGGAVIVPRGRDLILRRRLRTRRYVPCLLRLLRRRHGRRIR